MKQVGKWNTVLRKARTHSLQLEAVLRSCRPLREDCSAILCKHGFHYAELTKSAQLLQRILGIQPQIYTSIDDFKAELMKDPVIKCAVEELGAEVRIEYFRHT
jgi:hypothetical protein